MSSGGNLLAKGVGTAMIVASAACCDAAAADTALVMVQQTVAAVQVEPTSVTLDKGATRQLSAAALDAKGHKVAGASISWSSSNSSVVSVSSSGSVKAESDGNANVKASASGVEGSVSVAVRGPNGGSGGSVDRPNEPAGFSPWFHHDFSYLPTGTGGADRVPGSGAGALRIVHGLDNHAIVSEQNAPHGQAQSLRRKFPKGLAAGTTGGVWHAKAVDGSFDNQPELDEWYVSFWVMLEGPTWENPPGSVQKLWYNQVGTPGVPRGGSQNLRGAADETGSSPGTRGEAIRYRWMANHWTGPGNTSNMESSGLDFHVGQWHHFEQWGKMSDLNQANGFLRTYLDGKLIGSAENITNRNSERPGGFFGIHFAPVWGGNCSAGCPKERDDFMRIADFYISGIPHR